MDHVLVDRLSDPKTIEQLVLLLDKLETVGYLVNMLESFLSRGPELADSVNELIQVLREGLRTPEFISRAEVALNALRRMQELLDSPQVRSLFESGVLDPHAVSLVGKVARALTRAAASAHDPTVMQKRVGLLGLMRALSDPEVQPALNFVLSLARNLSRELSNA